MIPTRISVRSFYDFQPPRPHRTGDIWINMPTHGLLGRSISSAVVITPACDLANAKVETLTCLPILPIDTWMTTGGFFTEIRGTLLDLLQGLGIKGIGEILPKSRTPEEGAVPLILEQLEKQLVGKKAGANDHADRCRLLLEQIAKMVPGGAFTPDTQNLQLGLGAKRWDKVCGDIITNAYASDIHFLPPDQQDDSWSGVPQPSVVLFRYPMTVPVEIADLAQDLTVTDWPGAIDRLGERMPFARAFRGARPLKTLTIRTDFLSDLLTRFVSLYVRLGSPDFDSDAVTKMRSRIGVVEK